MRLIRVKGSLPVSEDLVFEFLTRSVGECKDKHAMQVLVVAGLTNLGYELGYQPHPEYRIPATFMRSGRGYIDLVWLTGETISCAFEVVNSAGGPRDFAKLSLCENGYLVQLSKYGIKRRNVIKAEGMTMAPIGSLQNQYWQPIPGTPLSRQF